MTHKKKKHNHNTHVQKKANQYWKLGGFVVAALVVLIGFSTVRLKANLSEGFVPQVKGEPAIAVVSEAVIDHGNQIVNRFITSSFEVQNIGDETLHIFGAWVQVHEGCCPPQAVVDEESLRPGEITTVSMRYTMHPGMDGPHDLRIHLATNDPDNPEIELTALSNWGGN